MLGRLLARFPGLRLEGPPGNYAPRGHEFRKPGSLPVRTTH